MQRSGRGNLVSTFPNNRVDELLLHWKNENEELVIILSTDISNGGVAFELSMTLTGLDKTDVCIEVVDDYPTIKADIETEPPWGRQGVRTQFFLPRLCATKNVDFEKVDARNGLSTLKIGKRKSADDSER